jgi:hypothetical protein
MGKVLILLGWWMLLISSRLQNVYRKVFYLKALGVKCSID